MIVNTSGNKIKTKLKGSTIKPKPEYMLTVKVYWKDCTNFITSQRLWLLSKFLVIRKH